MSEHRTQEIALMLHRINLTHVPRTVKYAVVKITGNPCDKAISQIVCTFLKRNRSSQLRSFSWARQGAEGQRYRSTLSARQQVRVQSPVYFAQRLLHVFGCMCM
jgi:hypothetical protein